MSADKHIQSIPVNSKFTKKRKIIAHPKEAEFSPTLLHFDPSFVMEITTIFTPLKTSSMTYML